MGRGSLGACLAWLGAAPQAARKGRQPPRGRQGSFRKRRTWLIHTEGQEAHRGQGGQPAVGRAASHICWARPPLSRLSCWRGAASSGGSSSSSSLGGTRSSWGARRSSASKPALVMSRGSGTSQPRSKTLGCLGDMGTHGAQQTPANLALWEAHHTRETQQLSCQWGWWTCGDRVAELRQAAWLSPSQPFLHLVLKEAGVQSDPRPGNACGPQE